MTKTKSDIKIFFNGEEAEGTLIPLGERQHFSHEWYLRGQRDKESPSLEYAVLPKSIADLGDYENEEDRIIEIHISSSKEAELGTISFEEEHSEWNNRDSDELHGYSTKMTTNTYPCKYWSIDRYVAIFSDGEELASEEIEANATEEALEKIVDLLEAKKEELLLLQAKYESFPTRWGVDGDKMQISYEICTNADTARNRHKLRFETVMGEYSSAQFRALVQSEFAAVLSIADKFKEDIATAIPQEELQAIVEYSYLHGVHQLPESIASAIAANLPAIDEKLAKVFVGGIEIRDPLTFEERDAAELHFVVDGKIVSGVSRPSRASFQISTSHKCWLIEQQAQGRFDAAKWDWEGKIIPKGFGFEISGSPKDWVVISNHQYPNGITLCIEVAKGGATELMNLSSLDWQSLLSSAIAKNQNASEKAFMEQEKYREAARQAEEKKAQIDAFRKAGKPIPKHLR